MSSLKFSGPQIVVQEDSWSQSAPKLTALLDGGFLAVYEAAPESGSDTNITGQLFNADGSPRGTAFTINSTSAGYQDRPSVSILEDGRIVVAWRHITEDFSAIDIRARVLNANGTADTADFLVNSQVTLDSQDYPSVTALSNGGFAIGYNDFNDYGIDIRTKIFGSDGLPKSAEFIANGTTGGSQERASLAGLANGSFVIVYTDSSFSPDDPDSLAVRGRIVSNDGVAGTEFLIPTTVEAAQSDAQVTALANGNFVVVWTTYSWQSRITDIQAQVFASDGTKLGTEISVASGLTGEAGQPVVESRADGGFIIAYGSSEAGDADVRVVMYDAIGIPDGSSVFANTNRDGFQGKPSIVSLANGDVVVSWQDSLPGQYLTHIRAQMFSIEAGNEEPTGQVITGTSGNDSLPGTDRNDQIIGLDGNDALFGLAGADTLFGGGGNDSLQGGADNDIFDGGSGTNTAIFSGLSTDYTTTPNGDGTFTVDDQVAGRDGSDVLKNIRFMHFEGDKTTVALINHDVKNLAITATQFAENTLVNTAVASFSATDADGDAIRYSLVTTDVPFKLDGNKLILTRALDHETTAQYVLIVKADDGYGKDTTQTFTINITDVVESDDPKDPNNPNLPLTLWGTPKNDVLRGRNANDVLYGEKGDDKLYGGAGNDKLYGRAGKDTLDGGDGKDVFVFDTKLSRSSKTNNANLDKIVDFIVKDDTIHLKKSVFTKMAKKGVIKSGEFYQGVKAHDRDDHIIYNKKTGALYYDADGTGSQAEIQIATLSKNLKITDKDFFVI